MCSLCNRVATYQLARVYKLTVDKNQLFKKFPTSTAYCSNVVQKPDNITVSLSVASRINAIEFISNQVSMS